MLPETTTQKLDTAVLKLQGLPKYSYRVQKIVKLQATMHDLMWFTSYPAVGLPGLDCVWRIRSGGNLLKLTMPNAR
jgi:hypothetical protein